MIIRNRNACDVFSGFFFLPLLKKQNSMREKEFDFVIYPLKLVITIGMDYETLCSRFVNAEPGQEGNWGEEGEFDDCGSFVNLVTDKNDGDKRKILWNFESSDYMTMKTICHEAFHVATSVCGFAHMSLGFGVSEDEHAAYIAGFAGDCASYMFGLVEEKEKKK